MAASRALALAGLVGGFSMAVSAYDSLGPEKLALLQDSGGWEYLSMNDRQNGFPTEHTCFDGQPHPDECSGTLTLTRSGEFVQRVSINHQSVSRNGTYELNGDQLAFFDEFGTRDGPYTIAIDSDKKLMTMNMPQIKVNLQLEKEYRKELAERKKQAR